MAEKQAEVAEQSKIVTALLACREQLKMAHDDLTDVGVGCDGTCSYSDALRMADEALAEAGVK